MGAARVNVPVVRVSPRRRSMAIILAMSRHCCGTASTQRAAEINCQRDLFIFIFILFLFYFAAQIHSAGHSVEVDVLPLHFGPPKPHTMHQVAAQAMFAPA